VSTSLTNLGEQELLLLLSAIDSLVADLESTSGDAQPFEYEEFGWAEIARMRERIQAARRRVRARS